MSTELFAFDSMEFDYPKASVRETDDNGFMHVAISPLTKEQVAPYYGREIPDWQQLGFEPNKVYYGYRSAEELSKPETVNSVNGIPLQLQHHPDFANAPAKETRVGATGTDGAWKPPYLMNSLVVFDKVAQDGIESHKMRELSLAYRYTPIKKSGEALGQHYDFLMTNISANHIALVEQGRAGSDVLVLDHNSIKPKDTSPMFDEDKDKDEEVIDKKLCDDDEPNPEAEQGDKPPVEPEKSADERLAVLEHEYQEMAMKLNKLLDVEKAEGHKELQTEAEDEDEPEDVEAEAEVEEEAPVAPESEEEAPAEGEAPDDGEDLAEEDEAEVVEDDDEEAPEAPAEEAEAEAPAEPEEGEEGEPEGGDDMIAYAMKECGMEGEEPEIQKAFAAGIKYGQKVVKGAQAPKKPEANAKVGAQDSALDIHKQAKEMLSAMQKVRPVLGDIKVDAYDSANDIYMSALKELGIKSVSKAEAPRAYEMYMRGRKSTEKKAIAQDAKSVKPDAISDILNKVNTSI